MPRECERCGSEEKIHRHHVWYGEGAEIRDLCAKCHGQISGINTSAYLKAYRVYGRKVPEKDRPLFRKLIFEEFMKTRPDELTGRGSRRRFVVRAWARRPQEFWAVCSIPVEGKGADWKYRETKTLEAERWYRKQRGIRG